MEDYIFWYIKKDEPNIYVGFNKELDSNSNLLGSTYDDYIKSNPSVWVKLNNDQIKFKKDNDGATVKEVFNMKITPIPEPTPEELRLKAIDIKINELNSIDYSHYYLDDKNVWINDRISLKDACSRKDKVELAGQLYPSNIVEYVIDDMSNYYDSCINTINLLTNSIYDAKTVEEVNSINVNVFTEFISITQSEVEQKINSNNTSLETQAVAFSRMMVNTPTMAAYIQPKDALSIQSLYPIWSEEYAELGKSVTTGFRFNYRSNENDSYTLYEVIQDHSLSDNWKPGVGTEALYKVIQEEHTGSLKDPIPWVHNMELTNGLYYIDKEIIYKCIRDSGQGMSFDLADLISGGYVEKVS